MLPLLNFVFMMLNGLLGIAIAKVLEVAACLFWYDSNAPEGDFHTSLSFLLIFSLCSLFLMCSPSHVLKTNFWVTVTPFFAWGPHLGFHLAIPFLVVSEYISAFVKFAHFVRHVAICLMCKTLMWLLPILCSLCGASELFLRQDGATTF